MPEAPLIVLMFRHIAHRVTGPDIFCDAGADTGHLAWLRGKECLSATDPRELAKESGIAIGIALVVDANRINGGVALLDHVQRVALGVMAGVIAAVADQDESLLLALALAE